MNRVVVKACCICAVMLLFCGSVALFVWFSGSVKSTDLNPNPAIPSYGHLLLMFLLLLCSFIIESILVNYEITTPCTGFIVIVGFIWGIAAYYSDNMFLLTKLVRMNAEEILYVYLPINIFQLAFTLDVTIFLKTLPQIVVIGSSVAVLTGLSFGMIARFVLAKSWDIMIGLELGLFGIPINPRNIVRILRQQSSKTKQISVLLDGEAIISFCVTEIACKVFTGISEVFVVTWYHVICIVLRGICIGILWGFMMGYISRYLFRKLYNDRLSIYILCFSAPFVTFTISDMYMAGSGTIAVMIVGAMLGLERTTLAKDLDILLVQFWDLASFTVDVILCTKCALVSALWIMPISEGKNYLLILVIYLSYYCCRFICFMIHAPILSRLGYGMDLKSLIVCVWGGLKSPFCLIVLGVFYERKIENRASVFLWFYMMGLYFFSVFINGSFTNLVLEFLGMKTISVARQINMNNCIKHILEKRRDSINVLKMDRYLADTNWSKVKIGTNIKHPYRLEFKDEDDFFIGYKFVYCDDCHKEVAQQPTKKELKEMKKEAKMRILKARKMSYSRQYENGMVSKAGIKVLNQVIELALDSEESEIKVEDLEKKLTYQDCFQRCILRETARIERKKDQQKYKPPRTYWRRICYHVIVKSRIFDKIMMGVVIIHFSIMITDQYYNPLIYNEKDVPKDMHYSFAVFSILCVFLYWIEFILKILAYSFLYICKHGLRLYFKSVCNVIDFISMITCTFASTYHLVKVSNDSLKNSFLYTSIGSFVAIVLIILRGLRILRIFHIFYPDILNCFLKQVEGKMSFSYELGKSYIFAETEITDMLPYMIDNDDIRNEMKKKIDTEKNRITKVLAEVQKERSWIGITVKTTRSIRTILNGMFEAIDQLKIAGWADSYEHKKLIEGMVELYKKVNSIKKVLPSPPKFLFNQVSWMAEDDMVINFLFENVTAKSFDEGEIVFEEGNVAEGIYIVVTGLFVLNYTPADYILKNMYEYGKLPVVDYIAGATYESEISEFISSGNCMGELSSITDRAYNCTIRAENHADVYILSRGVLRRAMELSSDPIIGLESRIWKEIAQRIASSVLMKVQAYRSYDLDEIKYLLERGFVPNLSNFKIFIVSDIIECILLIDGVVSDYNTKELYKAPCYIPRTVQKLVFPKSSLLNLPFDVETKLLIIPVKGVDAYDVMVVAQETCELIESGSISKCLQHASQNRLLRRRRRREQQSSRRKYSPLNSEEMYYETSKMETASTCISVQEEKEPEEIEEEECKIDYQNSKSQAL